MIESYICLCSLCMPILYMSFSLSALSGCDVYDSDDQPASSKRPRSRSHSGNARWKGYEPRPGVFVGPPRICGKSSPYDALYVAAKPGPKHGPKKRGLGSDTPGASKGKQLKIDHFIGWKLIICSDGPDFFSRFHQFHLHGPHGRMDRMLIYIYIYLLLSNLQVLQDAASCKDMLHYYEIMLNFILKYGVLDVSKIVSKEINTSVGWFAMQLLFKFKWNLRNWRAEAEEPLIGQNRSWQLTHSDGFADGAMKKKHPHRLHVALVAEEGDSLR